MNQTLSVAYVEDDELSRMVVEILLLEQMGLSNVAIFEDSHNLIERLEVLPFVPDVFLLDIHLKPINGFQILPLLRGHPVFASKPVVALTASVMNEEVELLKHVGFDGVLAKPLNELVFPTTLERILGGEHVWNV